MIKSLKSNDEEKNLKSSQRKRTCYIQSNKEKDDSGFLGFLVGNKTKKKLCGNIFKVLKEKKNRSTQNPTPGKNTYEKGRQMKTLSDIQKLK